VNKPNPSCFLLLVGGDDFSLIATHKKGCIPFFYGCALSNAVELINKSTGQSCQNAPCDMKTFNAAY